MEVELLIIDLLVLVTWVGLFAGTCRGVVRRRLSPLRIALAALGLTLAFWLVAILAIALYGLVLGLNLTQTLTLIVSSTSTQAGEEPVNGRGSLPLLYGGAGFVVYFMLWVCVLVLALRSRLDDSWFLRLVRFTHAPGDRWATEKPPRKAPLTDSWAAQPQGLMKILRGRQADSEYDARMKLRGVKDLKKESVVSFDGTTVRYHEVRSWEDKPIDWEIELSKVRIMYERTTPFGPFADDYFFDFIVDAETVYEASFYAEGSRGLLEGLSQALSCELNASLCQSTDWAEAIMWPPHLVGETLHDWFPADDQNLLLRWLKRRLGIGRVEYTQVIRDHLAKRE